MYIKKMLKNIFMRGKLMVWKKAKLKMKTGQTYKVVLVVKTCLPFQETLEMQD